MISTPSKKRSYASTSSGKRTKTSNRTIRRATTSAVPRSLVAVRVRGSTFPQRLRTNMRFGQIYTLTSDAAGLVQDYFCMNGITQCDSVGGAGSKPKYWQNCLDLYHGYVVHGAKITVRFVDDPFKINTVSGYIQWGTTVTMYMEDLTNGVLGTASDMFNKPNSITRACGNITNFNPMTMRYSGTQIYGPNLIGNSAQRGSGSSNPAQLFFCYVAFLTSLAATQVRFSVQIDYDVEWFELKVDT